MYKKPKEKETVIEITEHDPKHEGVVNDFADAVLNKKELKIKAEEGYNSVALCNAIYLSSFLDKEITIPCDEELYNKELEERRKNSHYREKAKNSLSGILSSYDDGVINGYTNRIIK